MLVYTDMVTDTLIIDVSAQLLAVLQFSAKISPAKFIPAQLEYRRG